MDYEDVDGVEPIAIIGMSCRFPGANNLREFWHNLQTGKESITFFSEEQLLAAGLDKRLTGNPAYIKAGGVLEGIEMFDHSFFNLSMEEAEMIDPQQRIFLECAYEAFEDAGCVPGAVGDEVGVFGGMRSSQYAMTLAPVLMLKGTLKSFDAMLGTAVEQGCLRISYTLNLKGPSVGVQSACSTALVATHLACDSLRNRECDMALAGASALFIPQEQGYLYDDKMVLSPDGHCRAFDNKAQGYVTSSGVGMILLKRLSTAVRDNNHIYSVIKGSAINNDGSAKVGFRAPSVEGQQRVIEEALLMAEVPADSISYVEAHGTGTFIGDSMEIEALSRVFRKQTAKQHFCGIGSVKTNIGHVSQATGIAGIIKTALSLKNKQIPPSLNCKDPNSKLQGSPFYVVREALNWEAGTQPRRAGVSSFAIGGTNAHMVLEEPPERPGAKGDERGVRSHLLTISAKNESGLEKLLARYSTYLKSDVDSTIEEICFTSNIGRYHYPFRFYAVAESKQQFYEKIDRFDPGDREPWWGAAEQPAEQTQAGVAFFFPESQDGLIALAQNHYNREPEFKESIDLCTALLGENHNITHLLEIIMGIGTAKNISPLITVFSIEYALAKIWISWGITPASVLGHGVGEYVASCIAGVFDLEDALKLVVASEELAASVYHRGNGGDSMPLLQEVLAGIAINKPSLEIVLSSQGQIKNKSAIYDRTYWLNRVDDPAELRFEWDSLQRNDIRFLLILGSDANVMSQFRKVNQADDIIALQLVKGNHDEWQTALECLGKLYAVGVDVNWSQFVRKFECQRVSLPTYAFDKKLCWFSG